MLLKLPAHAIELVQEALNASFWRKSALCRFLRRMHVKDEAIAQLNGDTTKRAFIDWLFQKLEATDRGLELIRHIANELAVQTRFPDLEGWEDSKDKKAKATEAVSALKQWLQQEALSRDDELTKRKRREAAERERASRASHAAGLSSLANRLDQLAASIGTPRGGYDFQDWFGDLCAHFELDYKKPYRANGRETDGSLTVGDMTYLLSLKFEARQTAPADISELKGRLHKVADFTMGLFVSMSGFGETAKTETSGSQSSILLLDHSHLYCILSGAMSLGDLVARVRRHASRTGEAYLDVKRLGD